MKNRAGLMNLYKSFTGRTIARPNHFNTNTSYFEERIIQEYSYIPEYLREVVQMVHVFCKEGPQVRDIPDDYDIISDSQEIQAIKEYLGSPSWFDYRCLFVKTVEGDYGPIMYGLHNLIPWMTYKTDMIYRVYSTSDPLCPDCMKD